MKTISIIMLCMTLVSGVLIGSLFLEQQQQASAQMGMQMMNPKMMGNATATMNPKMMGPMMNNGSLMNPMFMQSQNITGSIKLMPSMFDSIASQIKVSLSDAAATAQNQVGNNSHVVAAHLDVLNGYLTYVICAIDPDMNLNRLVIDAGNGKVLSSSKIPWQNMMMFSGRMGPMMMNPNMMGNMMGPMMMNPNMMGNMMGPMMMNPNMMGPMMMNPNMMGPMMMNPNMMGPMMGSR